MPMIMGMGMGINKGGGSTKKWLPTVSVSAGSQVVSFAWTGQPTSGNLTTLVTAGLVKYTGTITAAYSGGAWNFTMSAGATITPKKINLVRLYLDGNSISWTYSGALPTGLTTIYLSGNFLAWTGLDLSGTGNITTFTLSNYRTGGDAGMLTGANLVTMLTSLVGRVGSLPATITIKEYVNAGTSESPTIAQINAATPLIGGTIAEQAKYWLDALIAKAPNNPHTVNISKT